MTAISKSDKESTFNRNQYLISFLTLKKTTLLLKQREAALFGTRAESVS